MTTVKWTDACHNGMLYYIEQYTDFRSIEMLFGTLFPHIYIALAQCTYRVSGVLSIISPQFSDSHCWPIYWLTFPCYKYVRDFKRARKITVYMKHAVFPLQVWLCVCGFFVVTLDRSFVRSSHTISHLFVLSI